MQPRPPFPIEPASIRRRLEVILKSAAFERAERCRGLLKYVVEAALEGRGESIKESIIGVHVFHRPPDYQPKSDPVVRVSMGRLRAILKRYYESEGAGEPIRIVIPKGGYVPEFTHVQAAAVPARRAWRKALIAGIASAMALIGASYVAMRTESRPPSLDHLRPFLTAGAPNHVAFSPSGDRLAFDMETQETGHRNLYVQALSESTPTRLSSDGGNATCPAWSPDGFQIAFLRDLSPNASSIVIELVKDHSERTLGELRKGSAPWLMWSPDGRWLAAAEPDTDGSRRIVLIGAGDGARRWLTHPNPLWRGDSLPVFSADSSAVAFRRTTPLSGNEDVFMIGITGGPETRLTFDGLGIGGLAFLKDGGLLFSSMRAGPIRGIWWLGASRRQLLRLTPGTVDAGTLAVSRDDRHMAIVTRDFDVNVWRVGADGNGRAVPLIASELPDSSPQFSGDGNRLAFSSMRTGADAIWTSRSDGANPRLLFDGGGRDIGNQRWSPDGRQIAFQWRPGDKAGIYLIDSAGGKPRPLVADGYNNSTPAWSRDGSFIYFLSSRSGSGQIWRVAAAGGAVVPITRLGALALQISRAGDALFYLEDAPGSNLHTLWRLPLRNGLPSGDRSPVIPDMNASDWANWAVGRNGIYFMRRRKSQPSAVEYLDFATAATRTVYALSQPPAFGGGLAISPDERTILFTQVDRDGARIFVQ